jgi:hypothetical protein
MAVLGRSPGRAAAHGLLAMSAALCWRLPAASAQDSEVAPAAQQEEPSILELRVTSARPGLASVDRGANDGLRQGDRVFFLPREGGTFMGIVSEVAERSATVELGDPALLPAPGTRAQAQIPAERLGPPPQREDPAAEAAPQQAPGETPPDSGHPGWTNQDKGWSSEKPLLAKVQPVKPEERAPSVTGRAYLIADEIDSTEDDRRDSFYRLGASVEYENLSGRGDALHVDGELNYRRTEVPDGDDQDLSRLRLDRLSYTWGGTRFAAERWELGRFLSHGMPEFGPVDGVEYAWRMPNGHSWGASAGWMPEPDKDYQSGHDFQVSAYYRWVHDASEQLTAAAGFQKTFHDTNADRDLLVTKLAYLPMEGWNFVGTAWVDVYGSGDEAKGSGIDLTQLYATTGVRGDDGAALDLVWSHLAFPDIDRNEFLAPLDQDALADDHNDRLAMRLRQPWGKARQWRLSMGAWADEHDEGGDVELGIDWRDLVLDDSRTDVAAFATDGRFVTSLGGRFSLRWDAPRGQWSTDYEFAHHDVDGFAADNDDIPQHRVRFSRDYFTPSGWSFEGHLEAGFWDDEHSITAGFYLQRSF